MARIPRILVTGESTAYHVISRTALPGYPLEDIEKDFFVSLLKKLSLLYFVEIYGFCCMGNHFHILFRIQPNTDFIDADILKRITSFYGEDRIIEEGQISFFRHKLSSLSEFMREIKVGFARFYNKRHGRHGYFWGDRFKSVVVEKGATHKNCLAYIDLSPVRAGIVKRPEGYRWNSIGYCQRANGKQR
jgi:REP element-mobilizing transposase RayT